MLLLAARAHAAQPLHRPPRFSAPALSCSSTHSLCTCRASPLACVRACVRVSSCLVSSRLSPVCPVLSLLSSSHSPQSPVPPRRSCFVVVLSRLGPRATARFASLPERSLCSPSHDCSRHRVGSCRVVSCRRRSRSTQLPQSSTARPAERATSDGTAYAPPSCLARDARTAHAHTAQRHAPYRRFVSSCIAVDIDVRTMP